MDTTTSATILHGDCRAQMAELPEASVDAIVTDPPYALTANKKGGSGEASLNLETPYGRARITTGGGFMGKQWDAKLPTVEMWTEALRVLKPGGHLLAFGGTRTYHRLTCAIEDAGFEIRDCLMWVYGSGFPKSLDVSKAIDKAAGAEREVVGEKLTGKARTGDGWNGGQQMVPVTSPATSAAQQWSGWGTALKPAYEPIILARKPLIGTVAANVLAYGTGAINVDGCRVAGEKGVPASLSAAGLHGWSTGGDMGRKAVQNGRWPANLIHDGSDEVVGLFPQTTSGKGDVSTKQREDGDGGCMSGGSRLIGDSGSAARFFYCAKASKRDRELGMDDDAPLITASEMVEREDGSAGMDSPRAGAGRTGGSKNGHPTVKPTTLMRYLCRLITPPGGTVLDPFCGSGSTGVAALLEGCSFIGIDAERQWADLARRRCEGIILGRTPILTLTSRS